MQCARRRHGPRRGYGAGTYAPAGPAGRGQVLPARHTPTLGAVSLRVCVRFVSQTYPSEGCLFHAAPRDVAPLVQSSDGGVREQPRAGNVVPNNVSSNVGTILAAAED